MGPSDPKEERSWGAARDKPGELGGGPCVKGLTNVAASVQETTRYHCRMSRQGMTRPTGTETGPPLGSGVVHRTPFPPWTAYLFCHSVFIASCPYSREGECSVVAAPQYLLSTYYMPSTVLGAGGYRWEHKSLPSSGESQPVSKINKYIICSMVMNMTAKNKTSTWSVE